MHMQEGTAFLTPSTESQMVVDRSVHGDLLRVNFNISFPALACEFASLDISDALGTVRIASRITWPDGIVGKIERQSV